MIMIDIICMISCCIAIASVHVRLTPAAAPPYILAMAICMHIGFDREFEAYNLILILKLKASAVKYHDTRAKESNKFKHQNIILQIDDAN